MENKECEYQDGLFHNQKELEAISWKILSHSHSETKQLNRRLKNGN